MEKKKKKSEKKPYVKPELIKEQILEQAALKCNKCVSGAPIQQPACRNRLYAS